MRSPLLAATLCLSLIGTARAEEATAPSAATATAAATATPAPAPAAPARLIGGNVGVLVGGVSDQPYAFGAIALNGGVILGLGVGFAYDGTAATDKFSALGILYGSYSFVNIANFAVGPELFVIVPLAPTPASTLTFRPGVALWYAPFSAPVLLGTAIDVDFTYVQAGGALKVSLVTPGLRLGYVF